MSLELHAATVRRGGRALLDAVDLPLHAGAFTVICGPNGAGKTTALSLLAGSMKPDGGHVTLDGVDVARLRPRALARRRAVLPQTPVLSFPFLVHEVVAMGRSPHHEGRGARVDPARDARIIAAAMERAAVSDLAARNYLTLSGGERQRVQLARALAQVWEPPDDGADRWLLLDEPTSALDLKHQIALMGLLRRLAGEGWGVLAILHDLRLAREHADEAVLLRGGRIVRAGPAEAALSPEAIQQVFDLDAPYAA